jgi:mannose-6-phosphate isomerase-like protein (cupin superfamily)
MTKDKIDLSTYAHYEAETRCVGAADQANRIIDLKANGATLYLGTVPPGFSGAVHAHAQASVSVVRSGTMRVWTAEKTFEVGPGDTLTLPAETPHSMDVVGDAPLHLTEILIPVSPI